MHACTYVCMYLRTYVCVYVCIYVRMYVCVCMSTPLTRKGSHAETKASRGRK